MFQQTSERGFLIAVESTVQPLVAFGQPLIIFGSRHFLIKTNVSSWCISSLSHSLLSSIPYFFLPAGHADMRSKSSEKHSIRVVTSGPQQSSSAPTRRHVAFRADHSGRLQQSVSYSHSEEPVPDDDVLPSLLEVVDDEDKNEAMDDPADAMEDQFFDLQNQVVPEKSMGPVCIVSIVYSYPVVNSFRIALSKTGCHFARNMSTNSCRWMALVILQSLQLALAVGSIGLFLSARTALVASCTVRSAHLKLIINSRFTDFG
jgi:hypothetical protein